MVSGRPKLNQMSADDIAHARKLSEEIYNDRLQDSLPKEESFTRAQRESLNWSLSRTCREIGRCMYQQGHRPDEIRRWLKESASFGLRQFRFMDPPKPDEDRLHEEYETILFLLICFGSETERTEASTIPTEMYLRTAGEDEPKPSGVAAWLEVLKRFPAEGVLDEAAYREGEASCLSDRATKLERVLTLQELQALRALVERDAATWNARLTEIIAWHKRKSLQGAWKLLDEAFICFPALALAHLGRQVGLTCTVKSPYLPLELLEVG